MLALVGAAMSLIVTTPLRAALLPATVVVAPLGAAFPPAMPSSVGAVSGRARSSLSPFERSGKIITSKIITTTTTNKKYRQVVPDKDERSGKIITSKIITTTTTNKKCRQVVPDKDGSVIDGRNSNNEDDDNNYWTCDDEDSDDHIKSLKSTTTAEEWEGLGSGQGDDRMIVWPPMVVLNTRRGKKVGSDKWLGIGNTELLHYFKDYEPVGARSAFGVNGHYKFSLLIFDSTISGYLQAERLHNRFIQEGRGKRQCHKQKLWKQTTGKCLLYGYMASKEEELAVFSSHSKDKEKLEYKMKSYQTVVGNPLKGMLQKQASLQKDIEKEIQQKNDMNEKLYQRDKEIEALKQKLSQKSDEHYNEIKNAEELVQSKIGKLKENRNKFVLSIQLRMIKFKLVRQSSQSM